MAEATCKKCGVTKPLADFPLREREGKVRTAACKACRAAYMKVWTNANFDRVLKARRVAKERHLRKPDERWATKLRLSFGLTIAEYRAMETAQGGLCAICKGPETTIDRRIGRPRLLAVDHCHETGKIRGLLCGDCNRSLGMMKEDIGALNRMISYIANHSTPERIAA